MSTGGWDQPDGSPCTICPAKFLSVSHPISNDVTNIRYNNPLDLSEILNWVLGDERHGLHGARHLASVDPLVRIEGYGEEEGSAAVPFNHQP